MGLVLVPFAVRWTVRPSVVIIGVVRTVVEVPFTILGALNSSTHIGLLIETVGYDDETLEMRHSMRRAAPGGA